MPRYGVCYNDFMAKNKLLLIDGSSLTYRAFFSMPESMTAPSGMHTNAIKGFDNMLTSLMKRLAPTHVLVAFDAGKTTFRTEMFADYKGGREKMPDSLREQWPFVKEMLTARGIAHYELTNYEADDIIGTLDKMAEAPDVDFDVTIVSGDKDLIQLTDGNTVVETSKKGVSEFEAWTPAYLMEKLGLTPAQFIDYKALMGDSSDNYAGVPNVGPKTALTWLHDWGDIDNLYAHIDELGNSARVKSLRENKDSAYLSRTLATIATDSPIEIGLDDTVYVGADEEKLTAFYAEMGFKTAVAKVAADSADDISVSWKIAGNADSVSVDDFFYMEILGENYHREPIAAFAWGNAEEQFVSHDIALLKNFKFPENTYDAKKNWVLLAREGIDYPRVSYDAMLAKYLVSTTEDNKIATIAQLYGNMLLSADDEVYGKGAKRALPADDVLFAHLARKIKVLALTKNRLLDELDENEQTALLTDMELPLAYVLADMEHTGIAVNPQMLHTIGAENTEKLSALTAEIYALAGEDFNINSPKQLGEILFDKLQVQGDKKIKKTKTGYSTAAAVLEELAPDVPLIAKILEYRQIAKVQSTYVQGLLPEIAADGRIHTRYVQDLTQTGRLSSVEPNLQNIPVRLEEGRKIRKAFVPAADSVFLSSDYSQIELRVLAQVARDPNLIAAFQNDEDVHTATAMRVFGIESADAVTANDRRSAKAVNFGISYGETEYGLAKRLSISNKEAATIISTYFARFPEIATYIDETKRDAKEKGYVSTMYGRRRKIPDINTRNFMLRQAAERQAINAPIQGSAGDILKVAMIALHQALADGNFQSKMLLQVHDEIILEVPKSELTDVQALVKTTMEQAATLAVPLKVEENTGETWYEAK